MTAMLQLPEARRRTPGASLPPEMRRAVGTARVPPSALCRMPQPYGDIRYRTDLPTLGRLLTALRVWGRADEA